MNFNTTQMIYKVFYSIKKWDSPASLFVLALSILLLSAGCTPSSKEVPTMKLGAYYFEAWAGKCPYDDGKPGHEWAKGMPTHVTKTLFTEYAGREPLWGWRADTKEIMEEQIDLSADHGISFFSFCWYWQDDNGPINVPLLESLPRNQGLNRFLEADNNDRMEFCLLVANFNKWNISGVDAWKQATEYWIDLFNHPSYLKLNGKPLIIIFNPDGVNEQELACIQEIAIENGFPGVEIAGRKGEPEQGYTLRAYYNKKSPECFKGKIVKRSFQELIDENAKVWKGSPEQPVIPMITKGWDNRPWQPKDDTGLGWLNENWNDCCYYEKGTPDEFENYLSKCVKWMDEHPDQITSDRLAVIYAWNEIAEGGWLMPCKDDPDGAYLKAIRRVVLNK